MAIEREGQWLGQQRVDAPHLRMVEKGVAHDFDVGFGRAIAGKKPVVVTGFRVLTANAVARPADQLRLQTAGGVLIHYEATEAGSMFSVPEDREVEVLNAVNHRVSGGFTPDARNYVGIDLVRAADDSTADRVAFMRPDTGQETAVTVPLARTMDYKVIVSTVDFESVPNVLPIAVVTTDASNKVTALEDARHLMHRLGTGGSNPNPVAPYSFPGGRDESSTVLQEVAGDRSITSMKQLVDAVMTRMWEVGGGPWWYSPTADRNIRLATDNPYPGTSGSGFEITGGNADVHWRGLVFVFDNSPAVMNEIADQTTNLVGLTDLDDDECVYVDLDRLEDRLRAGTPLQAVRGTLHTLGMSARPGQRWVLAWKVGGIIHVRDTITQGPPGNDGADGMNGTNGTNGTNGAAGAAGASLWNIAFETPGTGLADADGWSLSLSQAVSAVSDDGDPVLFPYVTGVNGSALRLSVIAKFLNTDSGVWRWTFTVYLNGSATGCEVIWDSDQTTGLIHEDLLTVSVPNGSTIEVRVYGSQVSGTTLTGGLDGRACVVVVA